VNSDCVNGGVCTSDLICVGRCIFSSKKLFAHSNIGLVNKTQLDLYISVLYRMNFVIKFYKIIYIWKVRLLLPSLLLILPFYWYLKDYRFELRSL